MTSTETLLTEYEALDSAAVSDALDALNLPSGQAGFLPVLGHPRIVGLAVTVQLEPYVPGPTGPHIGATAVAGATSTDVIVVANEGRTDISCWGGLVVVPRINAEEVLEKARRP